MTVEEPLVIQCEGARLIGILHRPAQPQPRAVLVIVGGPQYRVGSHRQFVLLARYLADRGYPVLRFDYRSMGDSEGLDIHFENAGADVRAALDALVRATGSGEIVIWGLCDAASAALLHAAVDERVRGLVLVNPWVRQEQSQARAHLQHYYSAKLLDREQWRRLLTGRVNVIKSGIDLLRTLRTSFGAGSAPGKTQASAPGGSGRSFVAGMLEGLERFRGKVLLILSGDDLTAAEFKDTAKHSRRWSRALARKSVARADLPEANHTFSKAVWRDEVAARTAEWLESL